MKKKLKRIITICLFATVLAGCQQQVEEIQENQSVNVEVINPSYENISVEGSFVGTVETGDVVSVYPKISAQVMAKYFEVGDYVNAGDLLFVLDDKALQIEKKNADASVRSAAADLNAKKASVKATQAAADETIGTMETAQFEREKAIREAEREALAARIAQQNSMMQIMSGLNGTGSGDDSSNSTAQMWEALANAEAAKGSFANAQDAKTLAQMLRSDYENYTKDSIIAEANAKIAEGEAAVAESASALKSAKVAQDLADLQLSYTNVTAPISGVIDAINVVQFGMASDSDAAYVITGQDSKKICFGVPENTKKKIEVGQDVTIQKDDKVFTAAVTKVNDTLQQGSMLFKVEAAIQDTEDINFVVGSRIKVLTSIDKQEHALAIPISALYYDDGKPYIYVVENGKAVRKDVITGISDSTKIQIVSGIGEDAQVVTSWSSSLKDQTDVIIINNKTNESSVDKTEGETKEDSHSKGIDISRKTDTQNKEGSASETKAVQ